jgi:imidazolonepropionase-like amidohydrolase
MVRSTIVSGATIIDGVGEKPLEGQCIWIEGARIRAIGRRGELAAAPSAQVIDARGKYVIPGLMNANVHLLCDVRLENLARYMGRYEELIAEAAQMALKNGLTTVFDTWGPRRFLMAVRDRVEANEIPGSRIFCAGNIIGFDGPFSEDFFADAAKVASAALIKRINAIWVENVGRHLMWHSPEQVAREVRAYIAKGVDFIKYASNEHGASAGAFLQFSPRVQEAMVNEAHRAGITAQAHTTTIEGLWIAVQAGCDLIQHANITGPVPIPEATLELLAERKTGAVIFPMTEKGLDWIRKNISDRSWTMWRASDTNARNLIRSRAPLLLANDGAILAPEALADPMYAKSWAGAPEAESLCKLTTGHFVWFKAMEEKGMAPMEMLRAATRNIAVAYGKEKDLGTLEPGKIADMIILDENPLESAEHYRGIHMILKNGVRVDREALPVNPVLTRPLESPVEEEASYVPFLSTDRFPMCPMCTCHPLDVHAR